MAVNTYSDHEIEKATGYIKDDKYLASIYGVPLFRVQRLRAQGDKKRREPTPSLEDKAPISMGERESLSRKAMEIGSERLRCAIMNFLAEREQRMRRI